MLRLPDNPDEWIPSVHSSGRHFLTNRRTSETRWLWQKWDVDGRIFVRNISDPNVRLWVDELDMPARIAAGAATPLEIEQFQRYQHPAPPPPPPLPPPPPPPPPPSQPHPGSYGQPSTLYPPQHQTASAFVRHEPNFTAPQQQPYIEYGAHQDSSYSAPYAGTQPRNPVPPNEVSSLQGPPQSTGIPLQTPPNEGGMQPSFRNNHEQNHYLPVPNTPEQNRHLSILNNPGTNRYPSPLDNREQNRYTPMKKDAGRMRASREENGNGGPPAGRYWSSAVSRPKKKAKRQSSNDHRIRDRAPANKAGATTRTRILRRQPPLPIAPGEFTAKRSADGMVLSKRAKHFYDAAVDKNDHDNKIAALYQRDFAHNMGNGAGSPCSVRAQDGESGFAFEAVVGTCEEIEKEYLRLTTAPRAEMIRPPRVLVQSLRRIKSFWSTGERDYDWVCRQLKSVRQDYKVQHIENSDVVDVYETHARIALTQSDLGEFNTCVAQVQELYEKVGQAEDAQDEFMSYRILYNLLVGARQWEQGKILSQFTKAERARPATSYALLIRQTIISGNYQHYFRLCFKPPPKTLISYLLVHFHDDMRYRALSTIVAAYGPGQPGYVPMSFIFDQFGYRAEYDDLEESEHKSIRQEFQKKVAESRLSTLFDPLKMLEQPSWSLKALTFLMSVGAVLVVKNSDKQTLSRIHLNCRATKAKGIKAPNAGKELITHAGS